MSIEQEIAGLTQSTTDLLDAVNTKKVTLDTAVSNAQTAVIDATSQVSLAAAEKVGAQDARDEAETHKDQAYTYSQSAASAVAYQDLTAIAESKAETAVDVFVYDTRKDSDGGAWRKRTQGTSWYNETLNTSTRGSRKEFPAVAVIVLSGSATGGSNQNKVTIYDGDDPSLPMWMVFGTRAQIEDMLGRRGVSSTAMKDGLLLVTANDSDVPGGFTPFIRINFISDVVKHTNTNGTYTFPNVIAERADAPYTTSSNTDTAYWKPAEGAIVNQTQNDVAITVLPDAPIDPDTGLPIPTIAVATNGGVSVIKDDGTVVDIGSSGDGSVIFTFDNRIAITNVSSGLQIGAIPNIDYGSQSAWRDYNVTSTTVPSDKTTGSDVLACGYNLYLGDSDGVTLLDENTTTPSEGSVAYITSTYNTGWMNGDIKLAALSDTDDTDLVGVELVTNGTFDSDLSGWTIDDSPVIVTWNAGGYVDIDRNGGSFSSHLEQTLTTVVGETYTVSLDILALSDGLSVRINTGDQTIEVTVGTLNHTFVATSTSSILRINVANNPVGTASIDNISVRLAEADRSVNGNGLQVFGTVTKEPVATGADLVAYSGWSRDASYVPVNCLQFNQNTLINYSADYYISLWVQRSTVYQTILSQGQSAGSTALNIRMISNGGQDFTVYMLGGEITGTGSIPINTWTKLDALYDASTNTCTAYVNGKLLGVSYSATQTTVPTSEFSFIGHSYGIPANPAGKISLLRVSQTLPTAEQVAKIYRDEKPLFQEGAQATLHGTSNSVTALAYDDSTDLLHVGTSAGRSVFKGLQRVDNTTDAVGTAISASDNFIAEE